MSVVFGIALLTMVVCERRQPQVLIWILSGSEAYYDQNGYCDQSSAMFDQVRPCRALEVILKGLESTCNELSYHHGRDAGSNTKIAAILAVVKLSNRSRSINIHSDGTKVFVRASTWQLNLQLRLDEERSPHISLFTSLVICLWIWASRLAQQIMLQASITQMKKAMSVQAFQKKQPLNLQSRKPKKKHTLPTPRNMNKHKIAAPTNFQKVLVQSPGI